MLSWKFSDPKFLIIITKNILGRLLFASRYLPNIFAIPNSNLIFTRRLLFKNDKSFIFHMNLQNLIFFFYLFYGISCQLKVPDEDLEDASNLLIVMKLNCILLILIM
jgi:hypothetical protein